MQLKHVAERPARKFTVPYWRAMETPQLQIEYNKYRQRLATAKMFALTPMVFVNAGGFLTLIYFSVNHKSFGMWPLLLTFMTAVLVDGLALSAYAYTRHHISQMETELKVREAIR